MSYHALDAIEQTQQEELLQAYELFDNRGKGFIDANALIDNMKSLGYEIDKRQVAQMMEYLDETGKGVITKENFLRFMTARLDYRDEQEELKQAFEFYDQMGKGLVKLSDLQRMAEELGEDREECARILREADKDEDGTLSWEEFMRVVKKTSYF